MEPTPRQIGLQDLPVELILDILDCLIQSTPGLNDHEAGHDKSWDSDWQKWERRLCFSPPVYSNGRWKFSRFYGWHQGLKLASISKSFYRAITPHIYKLDVQYNHASALLISARKGSLRAVSWSIMAGGAPVNQKDHTLFREAQSWGKSIEYNKFSALKCRTVVTDFTALHWATIFGHEDIVSFLLEQREIDIDIRVSDSYITTREHIVSYQFPFDTLFLSMFALLYGIPVIQHGRINTFTSMRSSLGRPAHIPVLNQIFEPRSDADGRAIGGANALYFALDDRVEMWTRAFREAQPGDWSRPRGGPDHAVATTRVLAARNNIAKMLLRAGSLLYTDRYKDSAAACPGLHALHQALAANNLVMADFLVKDWGIDFPELPWWLGYP